jgi:hypothetical protein
MINRFAALPTYATPFHHYYPSLSQIIQCQNLTMSCCPHKTTYSQRDFNFPNTSKEKDPPEVDNS